MPEIQAWLKRIGWSGWKITEASSDASFRSYYRLCKANPSAQSKPDKSYILMDSSRMAESLSPFVEIDEKLRTCGVHVPAIIEKNMKKGYLILEDFGSRHYLDLLNKENFRTLYKKAIDEIIKMQKANTQGLPSYDRDFLFLEMGLMQEWYVEKYLARHVTKREQKMIDNTLTMIADTVLEQPQNVFVHRDYHSRNIMLTPQNDIGIIDFQDARSGAVTYDLVSLLRDVYIAFDPKETERLALYFRDKSEIAAEDKTFMKWFDFMGLQRHIKILGIFARLALRDGKEGYLKDIPLTVKYVRDIGEKYPQIQPFAQWLKGM